MSQPPGTQSVTTDLCGIPPGAVSGPTPFPDCHAQWRWICRWLLPQRSATPLPTFLTLFSEPHTTRIPKRPPLAQTPVPLDGTTTIRISSFVRV